MNETVVLPRAERRRLLVIKLGGAIVTDKSKYRHLRKDTISSLGAALASVSKQLAASTEHVDLAIIHGAGSFGHFEAKQHALNSKHVCDVDKQTPLGVATCRASLAMLHSEVLNALTMAGLPAATAPVFPFGGVISEVDRNGDCDTPPYVAQVRSLLARGYVPVLHGDPVLIDQHATDGSQTCDSSASAVRGSDGTTGMRTRIVSGDEIARVLSAKLLRSSRSTSDGTELGDYDAATRATHDTPTASAWYDRIHVIFVTGAEGGYTSSPDESTVTSDDCKQHSPPRLISRIVVPCAATHNDSKHDTSTPVGIGAVSYELAGDDKTMVDDRARNDTSRQWSPSAQAPPAVADVTGGIVGKVQAAAGIARLGCRQSAPRVSAEVEGGALSRDAPVTVCIVGASTVKDGDAACSWALQQAVASVLHSHPLGDGSGSLLAHPGTRIVCRCHS